MFNYSIGGKYYVYEKKLKPINFKYIRFHQQHSCNSNKIFGMIAMKISLTIPFVDVS